MDETTQSFFFMFIGLGFFLTVIFLIFRDHRENRNFDAQREDLKYNRELNERREFGFQEVEEKIENARTKSRFRRKT